MTTSLVAVITSTVAIITVCLQALFGRKKNRSEVKHTDASTSKIAVEAAGLAVEILRTDIVHLSSTLSEERIAKDALAIEVVKLRTSLRDEVASKNALTIEFEKLRATLAQKVLSENALTAEVAALRNDVAMLHKIVVEAGLSIPSGLNVPKLP